MLRISIIITKTQQKRYGKKKRASIAIELLVLNDLDHTFTTQDNEKTNITIHQSTIVISTVIVVMNSRINTLLRLEIRAVKSTSSLNVFKIINLCLTH